MLVPSKIIPDIKKKIIYHMKITRINTVLLHAFIDSQKFQITSLRQDVNQMGRHTNITLY